MSIETNIPAGSVIRIYDGDYTVVTRDEYDAENGAGAYDIDVSQGIPVRDPLGYTDVIYDSELDEIENVTPPAPAEPETLTTIFSIPAFDWSSWLAPATTFDELFSNIKAPSLTPVSDAADWNATLIDAAVEHARTITFSYDKGAGVLERRTLQPTATSETKQGATIVVGHDPDRDDVRAYRLDRIQGYVEAF